MFNLSRIWRQVGRKELVSGVPAYVGATDASVGLGLLTRRFATEMNALSEKNLDRKKNGIERARPGNIIERRQGARFHLYSYILASHQLEPGMVVMNCDRSKPSKSGTFQPFQSASPDPQSTENSKDHVEGSYHLTSFSPSSAAYRYGILDPNSQIGNCIPLADIRMGTFIHDIECHPGQGAKLARSAGTYAKVVKVPGSQCLLRLPSGVEKLIDSRCRATIGVASNPKHGIKKLRKAGETRWLGRRPVVRGVAMNPVDHPHGGGEGRTKGGRPSVSPWGKPTKDGYKTAVRKHGL
uniref:Large ribosomal subunit protein uL2m n=1 Tax=Anthurium amnicola TaxID=1678845 RepID=A0A1D1ZEY4_9ARAE